MARESGEQWWWWSWLIADWTCQSMRRCKPARRIVAAESDCHAFRGAMKRTTMMRGRSAVANLFLPPTKLRWPRRRGYRGRAAVRLDEVVARGR